MHKIPLSVLYTQPDRPRQETRYARALAAFTDRFGQKPVRFFSAPGRSELCGNHTDHQKGNILACAIERDAIAVATPQADGTVTLLADGFGEFSLSLSDLAVREDEKGTSLALLRGVLAGLQKRGFQIGGAELYVTSEVLSGSGLSSSAAFEVLLGAVFSGLYNDGRVTPLELAQIAQEAENIYFGKPCGLMDQSACAYGGLVQIDFGGDTPKVDNLSVDLAAFGYSLCLVDTRGSHADLTDAYAAIPAEMCAVANFFGKSVLSQVDEEEFRAAIPALREKCGDRAVMRAMHFFAETQRAISAVIALKKADIGAFLDVISASGNSSFKFLQNVTAPKSSREQNLALGLCLSEAILGDNGICRVHGGGFAGTLQTFVKQPFLAQYCSEIEAIFGEGSCLCTGMRPYGAVEVSL